MALKIDGQLSSTKPSSDEEQARSGAGVRQSRFSALRAAGTALAAYSLGG